MLSDCTYIGYGFERDVSVYLNIAQLSDFCYNHTNCEIMYFCISEDE